MELYSDLDTSSETEAKSNGNLPLNPSVTEDKSRENRTLAYCNEPIHDEFDLLLGC
jgi:hypothetical protein